MHNAQFWIGIILIAADIFTFGFSCGINYSIKTLNQTIKRISKDMERNEQ